MRPHWRLHALDDGRLQPQFIDSHGPMLIVPEARCFLEPPNAEEAVYRMASSCAEAALRWHGLADWRRK